MNMIDKPNSSRRSSSRFEDLGPDRHIERAHGLIGDQDVGLSRQGARDADPLALTARELRRKAPDSRARKADEIDEPADPCIDSAARHQAMHPKHFGYGVAHPDARIQRGVGVLEHCLDPSPALP